MHIFSSVCYTNNRFLKFILIAVFMCFCIIANAQIVEKYAKGDVNKDGFVNAADIVDLANIILYENGHGNNASDTNTSVNKEKNVTILELTDGQTLNIDDFPENIMYGNTMSLYAKFNSFSGTIQIGKGTTRYGSAYLIIDNTTVTMISHYSEDIVEFSEDHNLEMSDYISITINQNIDLFKISIQTNGSNYTKIIPKYKQFNGTPYIKSTGTTLFDVKLTVSNTMLDSKLWAFGDSYFGISYNDRVMYWLKQWNCADFLIQGFAGQSSLYAYNDLKKLINFSCPKYIIWCLGMNDDNGSKKTNIEETSWYTYYKKIYDICESKGIVLFLSTIPTVLNTNCKNKSLISDFVKSSGHVYIDVAKAVGSNAQGQWYGYGTDYDYQYTDGVHPTSYGAEAIAKQFLIDLSIYKLAKIN